MPRNLFAQLAARVIPFAPFCDVRRMKRRAETLQRRRLLHLLNNGAEAEWGRSHDFSNLLTAQDPVTAYQRYVPLQRYADFETSIERMRRGGADILWPGAFRLFGVSGGTYSTGKIVPANPEMLSRTIRSGVAMTANYLAETGNLAAVTGAIIPLTGRLFPADDYPGTILGNFSGLLTQYRLEQFTSKRKRLPEWFPDTTESLYLADWEAKLNRLADVMMDRDVRYVALIPTWGLVFFQKLIDRYNVRFNASASCVRDIWPNIQLISSGGMPLGPYRGMLSKIIGPPDVDFLNTYGAMEAGLIAFQSSLSKPAMLLNTDGGNFFEFIRYEDRDREDADRFWVANLEVGQKYIPVISNSNGLWAYVVGDVVRFTEVHPPMLEVVGRTAEILSLHREGLTGDIARNVMEAACHRTGARSMQFHVTYSPIDSQMRRHEWFIEFDGEPCNINCFTAILDEELGQMCASYHRVRSYHGLDTPRIVPLPQGTMTDALRRLGKSLDAQTKIPAMTEGRELAEAISEVIHYGETSMTSLNSVASNAMISSR